MLCRVATILRGIFSVYKCEASAARVWEPYAKYALELLNEDDLLFEIERYQNERYINTSLSCATPNAQL
eukprot:122088-Prorocentrum_minimum.AAC.1